MVNLKIVVVSYNTKEVTLECLKSIFAQPDQKLKIAVWVVDNNSIDGTVEAIKNKFPQVKVIENNENVGFAPANNQALRQGLADYTLLLNSDTRVCQGALASLVNCAEQNNWGITSAKLLNPDGSFQPGGGELPTWKNILTWLSGLEGLFHLRSYHLRDEEQFARHVGWVGGTAMLISQKTISQIGYLDDQIFMYAEDVEYCWRAAKKGLKVGWCGDSLIVHLGGVSSKTQAKYNQWRGEFRGLLYLYQKYYGKLSALILRILISIFIWVRVIGFSLLGRREVAITYAKVFKTL